MNIVLLAVLVLPSCIAVAGRRAVAALPPSVAVRLLTLSAVITALATGLVLFVPVLFWLAQLPAAARLGHWSAGFLHEVQPAPAAVAVGAAGLLGVAVAAACVRGSRMIGELATVERLRRRMPGHDGVVILHDPTPDAYALLGLRGQTVLTTGLAAALSGPERRALLAHEASHRRHRHDLYVRLADLSGAVNPLLRKVSTAVRLGVERWADEDAATAVADRRLVALTLARAGLLTSKTPRRTAVLAMAQSDVVARTHALLLPAPSRRRPVAFALVAVWAAVTALGVALAWDTNHLFELAQAASVR
ncbi:MAG: M56 family metallopeptidase [Mycobacteriales bacterium]|nr:MAG: peptidase M48 [Pseudonocardiales bacterium]